MCNRCFGTGYIKTQIRSEFYKEREITYDMYKPCQCRTQQDNQERDTDNPNSNPKQWWKD